jgi:hypothetical protein
VSAAARTEDERAEEAAEEAAVPLDPGAVRRGVLAAVLALIFPGLGHLFLGRRARAALFAVIVIVAVALGAHLDGNLYTPVSGHPLTYLATLGCMGMGIPYFLLLYPMHYSGDVTSAGFDYGTAFLLSAGLMNLLLALDAWDIATGRKD